MFQRLSIQIKHRSEIVKNLSRLLSNQNGTKEIQLNQNFTPEDGYCLKSPYKDVYPSVLPIHEYVWKDISNWMDKDAIICGITARKYTYAQLRDACASLAFQLKMRYKLNYGDVIAICLPNIPEFAIALMGSIEAGLIVTTLNSNGSSHELKEQINRSNAVLLFGLSNDSERLLNIKEKNEKPLMIISIRTFENDQIPSGTTDFFELISEKRFTISSKMASNPNDCCILPFSSGTTGLPKGVMLPHTSLTMNCELLNVELPIEPLIISTSKEHQDVLPCVLPFFHMYGLMVLLISKLSLGCKLITLPTFKMDNFLSCIIDHKATFLHLVPHIMIHWSRYNQNSANKFERIRTVLSAASSLGAMDYDRFKRRYPHVELLQGYGLTETGGITAITPSGSRNFASIGPPSAGVKMKIVDSNDPNCKGLPANFTGEILIRGPNVMNGYWKNDEATNATLKNGWLCTGDLGSYDDQGFLYIKGRIKELIKVKSFQVSPAEIEEIIRDHSKVLDAVVIPIPDKTYGEVPRALVVKHIGVKLMENEVIDYIAKRVSEYKRLRGGVIFIESIPKTDTGKPLRRVLQKMYS